MISELRAWGLMAVVLVIWTALALASIVSGNGQAVPTISEGVPVLLVLVLLFDRIVWRWRLLHPWLVATPDLVGTWKGELTSLWTDGDGNRPAPKAAYLAIEQTLTSVRVRLFTDEAASEQIAGDVTKIAGERWAIAYVFRGEPSIEHRDKNKSPMHHGGALMKVIDGATRSLEGEYWSERAKGKLVLREHSGMVARSHDHANALTYGPVAVR